MIIENLKFLIKMYCISAITFIEVYAISKGLNGIVLSLCVAVLGGIAGYHIKKR